MTDTYTPDYNSYGTDPDPVTEPETVDVAVVDETPTTPAVKPARSRAKARGGRRRSTAGIDRADVVRVLDTRDRVTSLDTSTTELLAAVAATSTDVADLTVALLGDTDWAQPLTQVLELAEQDPFEALVEVTSLDDDIRRKLWNTIGKISGVEQARLNAAVGKAGQQIIEAVRDVAASRRDAIEAVLEAAE